MTGVQTCALPISPFYHARATFDSDIIDTQELTDLVSPKNNSAALIKATRGFYEQFRISLQGYKKPKYRAVSKILNMIHLETPKVLATSMLETTLTYVFSRLYLDDEEHQENTKGVDKYPEKSREVKTNIDDILLGALLQGAKTNPERLGVVRNIIGPIVSGVVRSIDKPFSENENGSIDHVRARRLQIAKKWYELLRQGKISLHPDVDTRALLRTVAYANVPDVEKMVALANNYHIFTESLEASNGETALHYSLTKTTNAYLDFKVLMGYPRQYNNTNKKPNSAGEMFMRNYAARIDKGLREQVTDNLKAKHDMSFVYFGQMAIKLIEEGFLKSSKPAARKIRERCLQ